MIAQLTGIISEKTAGRVVVDVRGVGYAVAIPFSTYYELGDEGEPVCLKIHTHVTETTLSLFGFLTEEERSLFLRLLQISGIGPKLAVTVLSGLPVNELVEAVRRGDIARLSGIPGVGKKTAGRMALELKDKVAELSAAGGEEPPVSASRVQQDVASALVNLGYARNRAEQAVAAAVQDEEIDAFDVLLRKALKHCSS